MSDWASVLTSALDGIRYGIVLLDKDFEARFINRAYYRIFALTPPPPGRTYHLSDLIDHARATGVYDPAGQAMDDYIRERLALIRDGTRSAMQFRVSDGRILNFEAKILPDGGRMITFDDVTGLVQAADRLRVLATVDDLTKLLNRRHFLDSLKNEFSRAQRHGRPLSVLMIDATISSRSTIGMAMPPVTTCCGPWPSDAWASSGKATSRAAWAARSSP